MGNAQGSFGSTEPKIPRGFTEDAKLNDSLWKLYSPDEKPEMDIIFFHGLQVDDLENSYWKTWLAMGSDEEIWPKWLAEIFPKARILFVSYNCIAARSLLNRSALGMDLVRDVIEDTKIDIGQNGPVFLVGHSLGGVVIKQFILSAQVRKRWYNPVKDAKQIGKIENFIRNLKGVAYYGTPTFGPGLHNHIGRLASQIKSKSPVLHLLKMLDEQTGWIKGEFEADCEDIYYATTSFEMAESEPVIYKKFDGTVLLDSSSRSQVEDSSVITRNHLTVCRARDREDEVLTNLVTLITKSGRERKRSNW